MKTGPIVPGRLEHDADGVPRSPEFDDRLPPAPGRAGPGPAGLPRRQRPARALARTRALRRPRDRLRPRQQLPRDLAGLARRSGPPGAAALHLDRGEAAAAPRPRRRAARRRPGTARGRARRGAGRRSPATCTGSPSRRDGCSCCSPSATSPTGFRNSSPASTPSSSTASRRRAIRRCGSRACSRPWRASPLPVRPPRPGRRRDRCATAWRRPASRCGASPAAAASARSRSPGSRPDSRRGRIRGQRLLLDAASGRPGRTAAGRDRRWRPRRLRPRLRSGRSAAGPRSCSSAIRPWRRKARATPPACSTASSTATTATMPASIGPPRTKRGGRSPRRSPATACAAASTGCCAWPARDADLAAMQALRRSARPAGGLRSGTSRGSDASRLAGIDLAAPGVALRRRRLGRAARPCAGLCGGGRRSARASLRPRRRRPSAARETAGSFSIRRRTCSPPPRSSCSPTPAPPSTCSAAAPCRLQPQPRPDERRGHRPLAGIVGAAPAARRLGLPAAAARRHDLARRDFRPGTTPIRSCAAKTTPRNVARLAGLLAEPPSRDALGELAGRVGWRWASPDRLPLDRAAALSGGRRRRSTSGRRRRTRPGPSSRGSRRGCRGCSCSLDWDRAASRGSALGARVLAACITGAPMPLEADLLDAIDPARFASRAFRRAGLPPGAAA